MDIVEAQRRVLKLIELAARGDTEEGRTAGVIACRLIHEHGLLIAKPSDFVPTQAPPPNAAPAHREPKRKRRNMRELADSAVTAADTVVTTVDAAGRIFTAVNGFRDVLRGGR